MFQGVEGVSANHAIKDFAWIVEYELRSRLFDTFRTVAQAGDISQRAQKDPETWRRNAFFKFLVSPDPEITLGAMTAALDKCLYPASQTHRDFKKHVEGIAKSILNHLSQLKQVKEFRDTASHPDKVFRKTDALKVARTCQSILDALVLTDHPGSSRTAGKA